MIIDQELVNDYKKHGAVLIRNVISNDWLEKLAQGIEKNFQNPSKYNVFMKKKMVKKFFMMIIVIGKE